MKWAAIGAALLATAALVWVWLPTTEEERILDQLERLAEAASLEPDPSPLVRAARGARVAAFFTDEARIDLGRPFRPVDGRDALTGLLAALRVPDEGVIVQLAEMSVSYDRRLLIARGRFTAWVRSRSASGEEIMGARTLVVALRRVDGDWLVNDLQSVDAAE